jgi:adenylosuccinate lyase
MEPTRDHTVDPTVAVLQIVAQTYQCSPELVQQCAQQTQAILDLVNADLTSLARNTIQRDLTESELAGLKLYATMHGIDIVVSYTEAVVQSVKVVTDKMQTDIAAAGSTQSD